MYLYIFDITYIYLVLSPRIIKQVFRRTWLSICSQLIEKKAIELT